MLDINEWTETRQWKRSVKCKRDTCDYLAIEILPEDSTMITGVCTKCGKTWVSYITAGGHPKEN